MAFPTTIQERVYSDGSVLEEIRTSHTGPASTFWVSTNLPITGKAMLDSTIGNNNCEVISYLFSGHGQGNYISNIRFYISDKNSVAQDMTFFMMKSTDFTSPGDFDDTHIYDGTVFWNVPDIDDGTANIGYMTDFTDNDDPTETEFIYFGVCVEAGKLTGTASWLNRLVFQYT